MNKELDEMFDNRLDLENCTYTNKELTHDIKIAMYDYAREYHESEVKKLNIGCVSKRFSLADLDRIIKTVDTLDELKYTLDL